MRFAEFNISEDQNEIGGFRLPDNISTTEDITNLQKVLASFQFLQPSQVTGKIDAATTAAIKQAQRLSSIPETGVPDAEFIKNVNTALLATPEIGGIMNHISNLIHTSMFSDGDAQITWSNTNNTQQPRGHGSKPTQPVPDDQIASLGDEPDPYAYTPKTTPKTTPKVEPEADEDPYKQFINDKVTPSKTSAKLDPALVDKIEEVAGKLGISPDTLMQIIHMESAGTFSPSVPAGHGGTHFGLIQFGREAAKSLGVSLNQLRNMSAIQQMDYVYKYYKLIGVQPGMSVGEVYMLTFLPIAKNWSNNTILGQKGNHSTIGGHSMHDIWKGNPSFGRNKKHSSDYFTKQDVITTINQHKLT